SPSLAPGWPTLPPRRVRAELATSPLLVQDVVQPCSSCLRWWCCDLGLAHRLDDLRGRTQAFHGMLPFESRKNEHPRGYHLSLSTVRPVFDGKVALADDEWQARVSARARTVVHQFRRGETEKQAKRVEPGV